MAVHSCTLAGIITWTEDCGGLHSMGSQESDMTEHLSTHAHTHSHANTHTQSLLLKHCSKFCNQEVGIPNFVLFQDYLCLFPCFSIEILGSICQFLQKVNWGFDSDYV